MSHTFDSLTAAQWERMADDYYRQASAIAQKHHDIGEIIKEVHRLAWLCGHAHGISRVLMKEDKE